MQDYLLNTCDMAIYMETYMVHILKFCFLGILNFNFQHFYIFKIMSLPYLDIQL